MSRNETPKTQVIHRVRISVAVTAIAVAGLALAGCGSAPATGGQAAVQTIGMSGAFLTDPFQVVLVKQVEQNAKGQGLNFLPATNAEADPGKQVTDISTLLTQNISGLVVAPVDSSAVVPGLDQAKAAGVPVVTVDVPPAGGEAYMVVRSDSYGMGQKACESLGRDIGSTGTVLNLQGDLASAAGLERSNGFTDCMAKNYPGIKVISRPTDWVASKAADTAQTVVGTTKLDGIFLASDSVMADSVSNVLKNQDKWAKTGEPGHIHVATIDGTPKALGLVKDGYFDTVISQPVDLYAKYSVAYLKDAIAGKKHAPGPTDHGSEIIEKDGQLTDVLPSPVVTSKNVGDPALWGNNL
ncbi:sugar ABC transporter substrate-binding protein [Arthrobacter sp. GCM10027362]|uniref:sugar ABC transporter substrate-binding protein n=1 Tax=Arthrobacter sp. GCM10027362 TaxID=3273379 RepID=UPI0036325110